MDLFSQAEHDEIAQAILLTPDAKLAEAVFASKKRQMEKMQSRAIIEASLGNRGALITVRDLDEACALANRIAPEHLELAVADPESLLPKIRHAGAIFMGHHASESLGDYCAGPNHVLPTSGTARFSSPLGVYDFQKRSSLIEVSQAGADVLGPVAAELAYGEGLQAHARTPPRVRTALTPSQRSVRILICQWPDLGAFQKVRSVRDFIVAPICRHEPHPVIDEGGKPVARSVIMDRTIGNVFVTLLRTRQFHAMRTTNEPTIHHGVRHFRMEL
jgi:hypothetical protein